MKILVVDDKASVRKAIIKILTSLGLEDVVEAEDGSDAWFKLKAEIKGVKKDDFDLIISDMEMPGMSGIDLLRHVREDRELKDIPFIMVTVVDKKEVILETVKLGVSGYILKPFTRELIENKLKKIGCI